MEGYAAESYGDGIAEVYDEWYPADADTYATVHALFGLAGDGPVLELGAGTGRLAVPLAATGVEVHALDSSPAMLSRLAAKPGGSRVVTHLADMAGEWPSGPFSLVAVAFNTLFNVTDATRQARVFMNAAHVLRPGGRFVVEAFLADPQRDGDRIEIRELRAGRVVLSVSRTDAASQQVEGHFIDLTDGAPVRLRPWSLRWATVAQLDAMATAAGLVVETRWASWAGDAFDDDSDNHVTIYRAPG
jgi:SAM-dependent methyltransferase